MKFAIINDIHIGVYRPFKGIYRKSTPYSERLLKAFVKKMNSSFKPDFVVQGGDMIEDENLKDDINNYKKGLSILSKLKCPVYHIIGNHELKFLSEKFLKQTLKYPKLYFSVDKEDFRFIFLFTKRYYPSKGINLSVQQINWLKRKVNTDKKIVLFSHYSLAKVNTKGNFWFGERPDLTYINNYKEFLRIIKGKNVKLAFNCHLHWNKKEVIQVVPFITVQSLVENISGKSKGPAANAYTLVEIKDNLVSIKTLGKGGVEYKIKI